MPAKKRYEHKITLGKDIDGNLIRKSFYSTKSKRDAKRKAEEYAETYKLNLLLGEPEKTKTITFEKWAIRCLELYKMPYVKANTYRDTYLAPVKRHLIPHFGKGRFKRFSRQRYRSTSTASTENTHPKQ